MTTKQKIQQEMRKKSPDYDRILSLINDHKKKTQEVSLKIMDLIAVSATNIPGSDIRDKAQIREYVYARFLVWKKLFEDHGWTYDRIGHEYGKDHATVIAGVRRTKELIDVNDEIFVPAWKEFNRQLNKINENVE